MARLRARRARAAATDRDESLVADLLERAQRGRQVEIAVAQHQLGFAAAAHVLDVHVREPARAATDAALDRPRLDGGAVAEIEREPEAGRIAQAPRERLEVVEALDEHPALGLEPDRHAHALGAREHALDAVHQQRPRADGIQGPAHRPRAQRHDWGAERSRHVDGAAQQLQPALAAVVEQARVVGAVAVEQVARVRLDHAREPVLVEQRPEPLRASPQPRRLRIEVDVIERERDAVVAGLAEERQRLFDPGRARPLET